MNGVPRTSSSVPRVPRACMRVALVALITLVGVAPARAQATPPKTADWLADFARLTDAMSRQYANLEWAVDRRGIRLPELARATEDALRSAGSDAAARAAIESFLAAFGDGHLEVRWPPAAPAATASAAPPGPPHVPGSAGSSPAVSHVGVCERLGYRQARRGGGVRFDLLPEFRWLPSPDSVYFRAGVLVAGDDRLGVLRIASFEDNIHPELCEAATRSLGITPDAPCDSACADHVSRETANQLTAVLERRIGALQAEGVTRLLVDVTRNGGGSNWVEAAARTLTAVPLQGARQGFIRHPHYARTFDADIARLARDSVVSSQAMRNRLGRALDVLRRQREEARTACDRSGRWEGGTPTCTLIVSDPPRYSTGLLPYAAPAEFDGTSAWRVLFTPSRYRYREGAYRGPLMVLVDGGTVSAAEYFAALLMDNSAALVVGAPTFGAGCGYTNGGIRTVLEHSKGRVLMPDCVRFRSNGINEVEGVAPDLPVRWHPNDSALQRARRVVETLMHAR